MDILLSVFVVSSHYVCFSATKNLEDITDYRAVVSGGAEGALAPPEIGSSVNPISTRGGRLCLPHYC